ncbi:MAG: hypothetical protein AAF388_22795 [Bacteroidota bacterium]
MTLHPDFKEFIESLNKNEVEYLLVGGYAVVIYGYVRATGDMDIWVNNSPENSIRVIEALKEFGFNFPNLDSSTIQQDDLVLQLGYPPYRIDIITTPSGVDFDVCYPKREIFQLEDEQSINVIDLDSLKQNKRSTGRNKDLDDIENLP